ncbi:hypothetical protein E3N88_03619 [Mikania micrantha]|uniref:Membrane-associated kinase regulator 6 n=1 Tax=Mikania micrantha TaxID=192012 RepID=A0A5N6Q7F7_9ASTR|nr:hypothetical protein E3N88_03619 [Mikania micrantha]
MEDLQQVCVESFSYTWLVNQNLFIDGPNRSFRLSFDDASFIEMDPKCTHSKRFFVDQDFDFNVPDSQPPMTLVHADKLFSNGILFPSKPSSSTNFCSSTVQREGRFRKSRSLSLRKCNKLPKMIIQKYMDLVRPFWCRMRRDSSRVENWECSSGASNTRRCDFESSIHEAVVHCKRTIGMN